MRGLLASTANEDAITYRGGSYVGNKPGKRTEVGNKRVDKQRGHSRRHQGDDMERSEQIGNGRLLRNYEPADLEVWPISPQPFPESHFATFPPELAERCIKAGCPAGGRVLDPFGGAGTTALVAATLGRKATLIELNPEYAILARARIESAFMGRDEGSRHMAKQLGKDKAPFEPGSLFAPAQAPEAAE